MADDTIRLDCGCVKKYYSGIGWEEKPCDAHKEYVPTLLDYAKVIDWLWDERHNIQENRRNGVHKADFPRELVRPFDDAMGRAALAREYAAELKKLDRDRID